MTFIKEEFCFERDGETGLQDNFQLPVFIGDIQTKTMKTDKKQTENSHRVEWIYYNGMWMGDISGELIAKNQQHHLFRIHRYRHMEKSRTDLPDEALQIGWGCKSGNLSVREFPILIFNA